MRQLRLLLRQLRLLLRRARLGHGRGYYDSFIRRQRALTRDASGGGSGGDGAAVPPIAVIGLALSDQIIEGVPMDAQYDERLDFVVTPEGALAYTSASDQAAAAALMEGKSSQAAGPAARRR